MLVICFYRKAGPPAAICGWYLGSYPDLDDLGFRQTKKGAPAFETPTFVVKGDNPLIMPERLSAIG